MRADAFKLAGTVLDGKYRVDEVIGEGGFGVVYKGFHTTFEHAIAIKCLKVPTHFVPEAQKVFFEKFREEGKLLSQLSGAHLSVVRVFDFGVTKSASVESIPYLVLEWLEGASLEDTLKERRAAKREPHSEKEAIELMLPAIDAIAAAHMMNIAHRDIKPPNIYVLSRAPASSKGATVKVLDFGIAKAMQEGETATQVKTRTSSGFSAFSPPYGAPEQFFAKRFGGTGPWTDVHALGLCLVELVSGRSPLDGDEVQELFESSSSDIRPTPRVRGATVSDSFELVMAKALAKMPKDRFANAGAFHAALENVFHGRPLAADQVPAPRVERAPVEADASIDTGVFLEAVAKADKKPVKGAPSSDKDSSSETKKLEESGSNVPIVAATLAGPAKVRKRSAALYIVPALLGLGGLSLYFSRGRAAPDDPKNAQSVEVSAAPSSIVSQPPVSIAEAFRLFWDRSNAQNITQAADAFQKACDTGNQDGCAGVGYSVYVGAAGKLDPVHALHLFEVSCAAGSLWGCNGLGDLYHDGFGVKRNYDKSLELLSKVCDAGETNGCTALSSLVWNGFGTKKDEKRSYELDKQACTAGNMKGCAIAGVHLFKGLGVDKDEKKGLSWINQSCDGGNMSGCITLASLCYEGTGISKDLARSAALYQKVCDNGAHYRGADGCRGAAAAYESGSGVTQDAAKATALYAKANALNEEGCGVDNGSDCAALASAYSNGKGVTKDLSKAAMYEQKACDGGVLQECILLGNAYSIGEGITKSVPRALSLYQKACDEGSLASCYQLGVEVEGQDTVRAISLYRLSCTGGYQESCDTLKNKGIPLVAPVEGTATPKATPKKPESTSFPTDSKVF